MAIADFEEHLRFSPRDPWAFSSIIGIAFGHFNAGRYAEAAVWTDKFMRAFPYYIGGLKIAVACYAEAGRIDDAKRVLADLFRLSPNWHLAKGWRGPSRAPEIAIKFQEGFRKAGL